MLGPGRVFGELALIDPQARRTATITAMQACETIALHRTQFEQLRTQHPEVDRFLLATLAAQVNRLSEHLLAVGRVAVRVLTPRAIRPSWPCSGRDGCSANWR